MLKNGRESLEFNCLKVLLRFFFFKYVRDILQVTVLIDHPVGVCMYVCMYNVYTLRVFPQRSDAHKAEMLTIYKNLRMRTPLYDVAGITVSFEEVNNRHSNIFF